MTLATEGSASSAGFAMWKLKIHSPGQKHGVSAMLSFAFGELLFHN